MPCWAIRSPAATSPEAFFRQTLASGCADGSVRIWDMATGQELECHSGHSSNLFDVYFNDEGACLAGGAGFGRGFPVDVWDAASRRVHSFPGHNLAVYEVQFSDDGRFVASGSCDCSLRVWDIQAG